MSTGLSLATHLDEHEERGVVKKMRIGVERIGPKENNEIPQHVHDQKCNEEDSCVGGAIVEVLTNGCMML